MYVQVGAFDVRGGDLVGRYWGLLEPGDDGGGVQEL